MPGIDPLSHFQVFAAFTAFNLASPDLSPVSRNRSPHARYAASCSRYLGPASVSPAEPAPVSSVALAPVSPVELTPVSPDLRPFASAIAAVHNWRYGKPDRSGSAWQALSDALDTLFSSEERCAGLLFRARWPRGFRCPACRHPKAFVIRTRRLPLFECCRCRRQTSVTSGTIMERSRTPLTSWFKALFLLSQPCGINAKQLSGLISVTYKTAWLIAHKIRHAMGRNEEGRLLRGLVKIHPVRYGYTGYHDAGHPLWLGVSVAKGRIVEIRCRQPAPEHVDANRNIRKEGWWAFCGRHVHPRAIVTPPERLKYGKDRMVPALVALGAAIGQWLNRTFGGIGAKHLQRYLDEYCFRINVHNRGEPVMERLLQGCARTGALTYRELIRRRPVLIAPWKAKGMPKNRWQGQHLKMWSL